MALSEMTTCEVATLIFEGETLEVREAARAEFDSRVIVFGSTSEMFDSI